jgi:acetylornithine deacetylase/succinyl-diaminopimelate desuccinylase-like protein
MLGKAYPVKINFSAPAVQAGAEAFRRGFGAEPVYLRGGGSLPIVHEMIQDLSQPGKEAIPVVMIGFGLPDDNTHAPNEKMFLPNFYNGIETVIHFIDLFAQV